MVLPPTAWSNPAHARSSAHELNASKLPITYVGDIAQMAPTVGFLESRLGRNGGNLTPAQWLRAGAPYRPLGARVNPSTAREVVVPTEEDKREVCRLYRVDYEAFDLPRPRECDGLFEGW